MTDLANRLEVGEQIDSYRIEALVAQSRNSSVYRAIDLRDGTTVALKVPDPEMETDPFLLERFRRAALIGEKLGHHGVMQVFNEIERSRVYMVMEWCPGELLGQIMKKGAMTPDRAIRITVSILEALQYLHDNGVVHRALTPDKIMVDQSDRIKLIGFNQASDATTRRLTFTNLTDELGTVDYVSPEQASGKRVDGRSDIYSMGVILYEMLTGKLPFAGASPLENLKSRVSAPPIPPSVALPSISPHLQEVIYRALEKDPKNRYARASDFAHDLQNLELVGIENRREMRDWRNQKNRLPRRILFYLVLLLVPIAILAAMVLMRPDK